MILKRGRFQAWYGDFRPHDVDVAGLLPSLSHDVQAYRGLGFSLEQIDGFGNVHVQGGRPVDAQNLVAFLDARAARGDVSCHRFHDDEYSVDHPHHNAKSAEFSAVAFHHASIQFGRENDAVRVKRAQHSVDGVVFEIARFDVFGQIFLNKHENAAQTKAHFPEVFEAVELKRFGLPLNFDLHLRRVFLDRFVEDAEQFGHAFLQTVQRGGNHRVGIETLRIDVVLLELQQDPVEHL